MQSSSPGLRSTRYAEKCFNQIYLDLYLDVMLEQIWMGGNQQKRLTLGFAAKA